MTQPPVPSPDNVNDPPLPAESQLADECARGVPSLRFFDVVGGPADVQGWSDAVRAYDRCILGLDGYTPPALDLRMDSVIRVSPRVQRYHITYAASDTYNGTPLRIPAFLFVPDGGTSVPAVIVYHGHGDGKIDVAEGDGTNENAVGRYLAESLGYVVLAPDSRTFGEFNFEDHTRYFTDLQQDPTQFYMAKLAQDGYQDLAVLASLPQVDSTRIGVAGISMGSWRAMQQAVLHDEIRASVIAGLYVPFGWLFGSENDGCQHVRPLALRIDMEDLAASLQPRSVEIMFGTNDWFYTMDAQPLIDRTAQIFATMGQSDHLVTDINPGVGHQFVNPHVAQYFLQQLGPGAWPITTP